MLCSNFYYIRISIAVKLHEDLQAGLSAHTLLSIESSKNCFTENRRDPLCSDPEDRDSALVRSVGTDLLSDTV
jgi:hypothetical protein